MQFEVVPEKNARNLQKRSMDFQEAQALWDDHWLEALAEPRSTVSTRLRDLGSFSKGCGIKRENASNAEQCAIAAVLSDMDAEITALEQCRDKTRAVKQGMMQQLLTDRVRLI